MTVANPIRQIVLGNGSAGTPSLTFQGSTNLQDGFYLKSDGVIGLSIAGSEVITWNSAGEIETDGAFSAGDGTAAAPSYSFTNDPNTGIYSSAADTIGLSAGGTLRMSLSTSLLSSTVAHAITATTNQLVLGTTNTLTITSPAPAASAVYTIPDVGTVASFVLNAGAQTIAGVKTFSSLPVLSAGISTSRLNVASTATIASLASSNGFVKLTGSTATDLQGIAAGVDGQQIVLYNATGQTLTIRNQSASAASGAKITTMTGADLTTTGNGSAIFIYDTNASPAEWVVVSFSA